MNGSDPDLVVVLTTLPDVDQARQMARRLLEDRLAACATVLPTAESHYVWNEECQSAVEVLVIIKTTRLAYPRLEARLKECHPYEVPEIVALPAVGAWPAYVAWVGAACGPGGD
ncbi:MAG: divalent-cation tolerance protein CutA [Verrucomicrobiales bacterium]